MKKFDIQATDFCKGIACLLLLTHHMAYGHDEFGRIIAALGGYSKVCVALYCLLSGYGLAVSSGSRSLREFFAIRLSKLYLGFWSVAVVFIPLSWLLLDRGIYQVFFGERVWLQLFAQLLGLQRYFYFTGFCGAWGFMSIILTLYLSFPILNWGCKENPVATLAACFAILFLPSFMAHWFLPFAFGIYAAQGDLVAKWGSFALTNKTRKRLAAGLLPAVGMIILLIRQRSTILGGLRMDGFFAAWIILCAFIVYNLVDKLKCCNPIKLGLVYLGKHSMNIYFLHAFFLLPIHGASLYSMGSPFWIFGILLLLCLLSSIAINTLKKAIGVTRIEKAIRNKVSANPQGSTSP